MPASVRSASLLAATMLVVAAAAGGATEETIVRRGRDRLETTVAGTLVLEAPSDRHGDLASLASGARQVLPRLEEDLGLALRRRFRIVLLPPSAGQSPAERELDSLAPPWAAGYVLAEQRLGAIRLDQVNRYPYRDALSVLTHELSHVLMHDAVGDALPTWFEEGVATWLGRRWGLRDTLVLSSNLLVGELPPLDRLDSLFYSSSSRARVAYAVSFDFVQWSVDRYGDGVVADIVRRAREQPFDEAWVAVTGETVASAEARWRRGSVLLYRWVPLLTGSGTLWIAITLLALLAGARRRRRTRRIFERWEREEAEERDDDEPPAGWVH